MREDTKPSCHFLFQAWVDLAGRINSPAPLPEDEETPLLTKMLFPAPYGVPEKKVKTTVKGTRHGLRRRSTLVISSDDETDPLAVDDDDEEGGGSPPVRAREKREASTSLEAEAPKRGRGSLAGDSAWDVDSSPRRPLRTKPWAAS